MVKSRGDKARSTESMADFRKRDADMSPKWWFRTLRNILQRRRPYFAHLAFTHRCNLRCRFCQIPQTHFDEVDTTGMMQIIDCLDRVGIAVLSVSGGGEPLLRSDFATLLNYAVDKGMYTKITSNGTMSPARYQQLLDSRVDEIGISLDGVEGNDLPFSHCGPKILASIRYLNDHLPAGKTLTLNITVSETNQEQVQQIVDYCTREFPRARLWLNPVVVGDGRLCVATQKKIDPKILRKLKSPTVLTPEFYRRACEQYFTDPKFQWGCLAGEFFFDIKPNGDFWLCQDRPLPERLNILDPLFEQKYRSADFSDRRRCSGCTYSCYFMTQKCFEPQAWPGLAVYWWQQNTRPGEPCRVTAERHGWFAGLLHFCGSRLAANAGLALQGARTVALLLVLGFSLGLGAQVVRTEPAEVIVAMEQRNLERHQALHSFTVYRDYRANNPRLRRQAALTVEVEFRAPSEKRFQVLERSGSESVYKRVFEPMLQAEMMNASATARAQSEISRRNYIFEYAGFDPETNSHIFNATPRTANKYLFRGRVWIDADEFAIRRIEGEPARSPSFWVKRSHFVHEYGKVGTFWLPISTRSESELRLFGRSQLTIDYFGYDCGTGVATSDVSLSQH
jgi:MoaA/NifB/PqqE/SkfB family radical SAM enzyme